MHKVSFLGLVLLFGVSGILILLLVSLLGFPAALILSSVAPSISQGVPANSKSIKLSWHPPNATSINDLETVINGTGVYGFVFNSSQLPEGEPYGTYDWCNMPHVRAQEYPRALESFELEYVELIHRHHKRTPYAANTFPQESYPWYCDDESLFHYGRTMTGNRSASTYWSLYTSRSNPLTPEGFHGTCQFPQITRGGLDDSWQHGKDLYGVYHDLLGFLPDQPGGQVTYRVTNNVITSQVAGMVVDAMYAPTAGFPLAIEPCSIDSLEPAYRCPTASSLYRAYGISSTNSNWTAHLAASQFLYNFIDDLSGVPPNHTGFHKSWDHYFDNLSSRQCHDKPLPCQISKATNCVNQTIADSVYRLGEYEYSYIYRDAPESLNASVASFGIWIAELAQNIRDRISGVSPVIYKHNIAHDGSISRLLSILQVDVMVWPGMGAEVVFEVYRRSGMRYVRILWGGRVLRSSNSDLGLVDMLPLDTLLAYFDGLVGVGASKIPGLCGIS